MSGYWNKILRINLSDRTFTWEETDRNVQQKYLGGKGFGRKFIYDEVNPNIDALGPENKLFFFTGPAAGTILPTTTRTSLHTLSPLTGVAVDSYCGGSLGIFLKKAGIDGMVIEGQSSLPITLFITEKGAEFHCAKHLWGKDSYETELQVKKDLKQPQARVLTIGPAGENLVRFASIGHDLHRHFGRGGGGAVMGAKKVKAIAVYGNQRIPVAFVNDLKQYTKDLARRIKEHPGTGKIFPIMGTPVGVDLGNAMGTFPSHYWTDGRVDHVDNINFNALQKHTLVKNAGCLGCPIRCANINHIQDGPYAGVRLDGPEFETIYAFGGLCGINDIRDIIKLNDTCDRLGLDTISAGNLIGLAMHGSKQNKLPLQHQIHYGDTEAALQLLSDIAYRQQLGATLADGIREAGRQLNMTEETIEVKGLDPAGYEPRALKGMALTYAVSTRGATHLSSTVYARELKGVARDIELPSGEPVNRFDTINRAPLVHAMMNLNTIADCFIFCRFLNRDLLTWEDYTTSYELVTGISRTKDELIQTAERIATISKLFNIKAGLTRQDDRLPQRFLTEPLGKGASSGYLITPEELSAMIDDYYALRDWDKEGCPTKETLAKLEL
ncbi:MAG: aldehyde ferredoxin oxidoreductase family protein [Clostridiales bacterium]|jgi:aldehyde:ferredoxin oxidoreductase|nr:aldehyde ferredoxin oxidoreductase family protein [Clostridiales bacterium]